MGIYLKVKIAGIVAFAFQPVSSFIGITKAIDLILDSIMVIIKAGVIPYLRSAAIIVCTAPEITSTLANLMAVTIVMVGLTPEPLVAMTGFVAVVIIVIHAAKEAFTAGAGFLTASVKMIVATPEVFAGLPDLFTVSVIVDCLTEKALAAVSILCL